MKVVITGSSGQVGTNLAVALLGAGHEVQGIDVRANPWTDAVATDVVDLVAVAHGRPWALPTRPDCIVHLAAWPKVHDLVVNPARALENIEMTFAVLQESRRLECPVLLRVSREVYGDIQRQTTREDEADHVVAESPYSASKLASEALLHSYSRCYGIPCLVTRLSNVYGRFDNDLARLERVVPLFVRAISDGQPVTIYGAEKVLDFTYVDDCVAALRRGLDALVSGRIERATVNVSYGEGHSLVELAELIGVAVGRPPTIRCEPSRPGEISRFVGDVSRARELLGFEPAVPLPTGIARYVDWCRARRWIR